jgi:CBS domain-containing protein
MPIEWPSVGDLMTAEPVTLPPEAQLSQALGLMRGRAFHELPVLRGRKLIGMITFESIARRTNLPLATKIEHLMILPPIVSPSTTYPEIAEQLLATGLRAAPVVGKKGELVGVISRTDMVRALPDLGPLAEHRVEEVASPANVVIPETERCGNLVAQIRLLEEHPLPVVDKRGRLVGAVGVADLGRVLWHPTQKGKRDIPTRGTVFDVEVGTIMHTPPLTVEPGTTTGEAARLMSHERVSSVFLVEEGFPTGVVSQADLLGLAVGGARPANAKPEDVYVQITGLRGSGDPQILTEVDRAVARGLRHIGRHVSPNLLSLHVTPHATHRTGDTTVEARLHTNRGIFYASHTGWNFYAGVTEVMNELAEQTRRSQDGRRRSGGSRKVVATDEPSVDEDLERRIRSATEEN